MLAAAREPSHDRPILFSDPMVLALLADKKTQTRRLVFQPAAHVYPGIARCVEVLDPWHNEALAGTPAAGSGHGGARRKLWYVEDHAGNLVGEIGRCPYGIPGDHLWVREAVVRTGPTSAIYRADGMPTPLDHWGWRRSFLPPMFMPRGLTRIRLEIVGVRVERLHEITEEGARSEGVELGDVATTANANSAVPSVTHRAAFERLWDEINGERADWASNPWVWVIVFRRLPC